MTNICWLERRLIRFSGTIRRSYVLRCSDCFDPWMWIFLSNAFPYCDLYDVNLQFDWQLKEAREGLWILMPGHEGLPWLWTEGSFDEAFSSAGFPIFIRELSFLFIVSLIPPLFVPHVFGVGGEWWGLGEMEDGVVLWA